jgi:hypothetical protein
MYTQLTSGILTTENKTLSAELKLAVIYAL